MKKFLSLVLALVMTMSLVTVSAGAADFADAEDITYTEAVDVLSTLGVLEGDETGFRPTDTLKRSEAAKIICALNLTPKTAALLNADTAPYADVAASHWAAGYIAEGKASGIIAGVGDNKFDPDGQLTGYAFLKMLLVSLGYDAAIEGFTGANWSINVAKLADDKGLTKGNDDFVGNAAVTREEAALYAFNALKATMVEYDDKGTQITINGAVIATGASKASAVTGTKADYDNINRTTVIVDGNAVYTVEFGEKVFGGLQRDLSVSADDLGTPAHGWTYTKSGKTEDIGTYADTATLVFTASVTADNMKKELKGYCTTDGSDVTNVVTNAASQTTATNVAVTPASIAALTGNGKTVELYIEDNDVYGVVVKAPILAKVDSITKTAENKTHGAYQTYQLKEDASGNLVNGKIFSTIVDEDADKDTIVTEAELAKKDVVTYYKGATKLYIDATESISGILSAVTSKGVLTIDGENYKKSAVTGAVTPVVGKKSQDFYVDSLGYVIKSYTDTPTNYAYVIPMTCKTVMVANDDDTFDTVNRATVVTVDGDVEIVFTSTDWSNYEGSVVTYTVNSKDKYVYSGVAGSAVTSIADDSTTVGALYANSNTLYVVVSYKDTDDDNAKDAFDTVTVYEGYEEAPAYTTLTNSVALDSDSTPNAIANIVFIGDVNASAVDTGKYVYYTGTYTNTTAGYIYDTIVAGEENETTKDRTGAQYNNALFLNTTTTTALVADGAKVENKGGLLYLDGAYTGKTVKADAPVYTINVDDDSVAVGTAADLLDSAVDTTGDNVNGVTTCGVYVEYNTNNTEVKTIYILFNSEA